MFKIQLPQFLTKNSLNWFFICKSSGIHLLQTLETDFLLIILRKHFELLMFQIVGNLCLVAAVVYHQFYGFVICFLVSVCVLLNVDSVHLRDYCVINYKENHWRLINQLLQPLNRKLIWKVMHIKYFLLALYFVRRILIIIVQHCGDHLLRIYETTNKENRWFHVDFKQVKHFLSEGCFDKFLHSFRVIVLF